MSKRVRVRFAPSPTGPLHIGGVRTALYNYLFAKKHGGDFLLRIEDTDQKRFVEGAEEYVIEALNWCGISPNEGQGVGGDLGPYKQSERMHLYREYADYLIEKGYAYYAFDTAEELDEQRERAKKESKNNFQYSAINRQYLKNSLSLSKEVVEEKMKNGDSYVIRIKLPRNEEVRFFDEIRGWVVVNTAHMDDKVLYKSDGLPTYHLANIVDDYLMKISHVIRGEEWLPSAPLHVLLYKYLGWENEMPKFAHLPLILKPDGNGKLSKRDGDRLGFPVFPIEWNAPDGAVSSGYRESGYFPEAHVNMLAFLGWNPGTPQEIFSLEELVEAFTLDRVGKSGSKFDPVKTQWFNQQYLRAKSGEELAKLLKPLLKFEVEETHLAKICELLKERASFIKDMTQDDYFFKAPTEYDAKTIKKKWKESTPDLISELIILFEGITNFNSQNIEIEFKKHLEEKGIGFGAIFPNFRVLVTGKGMGPSMFDISELLGKEEVVSRLKIGLEKLGKN